LDLVFTHPVEVLWNLDPASEKTEAPLIPRTWRIQGHHLDQGFARPSNGKRFSLGGLRD
jgi:hypothetical protein